MKKLICDRCGEEFAPLPDWAQAPAFEYRIVYARTFPFLAFDNIDLCRKCQKELYKFLHDGMDSETAGYDEIARVIDADERGDGNG